MRSLWRCQYITSLIGRIRVKNISEKEWETNGGKHGREKKIVINDVYSNITEIKKHESYLFIFIISIIYTHFIIRFIITLKYHK